MLGRSSSQMINRFQCFLLGLIIALILIHIAQSKEMRLNTTYLLVGTITTLIVSIVMDFETVIDFWDGKR